METEYSLAWSAYKRSNDYVHSVSVLLKKGHLQPYIDNILESAFAAGWNAKSDEMTDKNLNVSIQAFLPTTINNLN